MFKISLFTKIALSKSHISQKSHFQSHIFHKNHIYIISFLQKSHFQNFIFHKNRVFKILFFTKITSFEIKNSSDFMDKKCDFAPVCCAKMEFEL